jgi:hypothetical protein
LERSLSGLGVASDLPARGGDVASPQPTPQEAPDPQPGISGAISRRTVLGGGLAGLAALGGLAMFPGQLLAKESAGESFIILLNGRYQPVVHGPATNLHLSKVHLSDGSYSTTKIYPVQGVRGHTDFNKSIGNFYVQFVGDKCAYDLPGGSIAMQFTKSDYVTVPDEGGGVFWQGTFELKVIEATGRYRSYANGHNRMVDKLNLLTPGDGSGGAVEWCLCFISQA